MYEVSLVNQLHHDTVARWHREPLDNPYGGPLHGVCEQHACNYNLWHEEDIARRPDVDDAEIARVKRSIDTLNQQRNDWIEKLDALLLMHLEQAGVQPDDAAPLNTETPGSAIDRLSIMSLRIYHLHEIVDDPEAGEQRRASSKQRLETCYQQQADLSRSLRDLLDDILAGRKRLKLYKQMKMYNDPMFNPYLVKLKAPETV